MTMMDGKAGDAAEDMLLETYDTWQRARERVAKLNPDGAKWLTYDTAKQEGWMLWKDLIILAAEVDAGLKMRRALTLAPACRPRLIPGREELVVMPSSDGGTMLVGVWDRVKGCTTRPLVMLYPSMPECVALDNTVDVKWFDMSLDGDYIALVGNDTLYVINLYEMETQTIDTVKVNTLAFQPDGRLLVRAAGSRVTYYDPAIDMCVVEQAGRYTYPLSQPLNTGLEIGSYSQKEVIRYGLTGRTRKSTTLQERYLTMGKKDKERYNDWLDTQNVK